ncbi:hypothetical protein ACFQLX_23840 [Streptomyces polyrhachis]|uniref:Uncharacterized protein n=1 Tax=Streptomyces polyrhachis TaxID=1282885 RepID=A0ABW2GK98_9ACTN
MKRHRFEFGPLLVGLALLAVMAGAVLEASGDSGSTAGIASWPSWWPVVATAVAMTLGGGLSSLGWSRRSARRRRAAEAVEAYYQEHESHPPRLHDHGDRWR